MLPFVLGVPVGLATQGLSILVAMGTAVALARRDGLPAGRPFGALVVVVAAATAGAALSASTFPPPGGLRYPGAGIAVLVSLPFAGAVLGRCMSLLAFGDLLAAPLMFGMAVAKVGCFLHGCCHGWPSPQAWTVRYPRHSVPWFDQLAAGMIDTATAQSLPIHPLQLYAAAWFVCAGGVVLLARRRAPRAGQQLLLALALYAVGVLVTNRFQFPSDVQVAIVSGALLVGSALGMLALLGWGRNARPAAGRR